MPIDATYRQHHLDTEYDTAVRQSRMAANWQKYQQTKRLYPNLKYVRSKAAKPDENHLAFVGIIRPIEDPFWDVNYPPKRWRCQCGAEPTDEPETDIPDNLPPTNPEFAFNSGKTGQVFDLKNSEYIKSVSPKEQPALIRDAEKYVVKDMAKNAEYQPLYSSRKGGKASAHPMAFDNTDFSEVSAAARRLANKGDQVKILPDTNDTDLRKVLLPAGVKPNKCPDYLVNGFVADLKTLAAPTEQAVKGAVQRCYAQCNNLVLAVPESIGLDSSLLRRWLKGKLKSGYSKMENVWIEFDGQLHKLTREEILNDGWF